MTSLWILPEFHPFLIQGIYGKVCESWQHLSISYLFYIMLEWGYCVSAGLKIKAAFNLQHYKVNFTLQWRWALRFLWHFYVQMLLVLQIAAVSFRHGAQMWMLKHLPACNLNISKPAKCYQYLYWTNFHDRFLTGSHNQQSEQPFPPQTPSFVQVFLLSAYNLNTYSLLSKTPSLEAKEESKCHFMQQKWRLG